MGSLPRSSQANYEISFFDTDLSYGYYGRFSEKLTNFVSCHWPVMLLLYVIMLVSNYAKWIHGFGARLCYLDASTIVYATLTFKN